MNLLDKISAGITSTIDVIVEKNRQLAQLNRLSAIIKNEKAVLEHAYATLGKQYYKVLEKNAEAADTEHIREVIRFTEARLKKAQARYDYIKIFGMPVGSAGDVEMVHSVDDFDNGETDEQASAEEEAEDITIAVADETPDVKTEEEKPEEIKPEKTEEPKSEKKTENTKSKKTVQKKESTSVDAEAADDGDNV